MYTLTLRDRLFYCWNLSWAAYKKNPQDYLNEAEHGAVVLDHTKIRGWKLILVRHHDQLAVAFRGSRTHGLVAVWDKIQNIAIHLVRPRCILGAMEKQLDQWQKRYGPIRVLTGHSEGGYFATQLWSRVPKVWHVTFNGHKSNEGENHLNLRTQQDPVSKYFSSVDHYFTVGEGGHSLIEFKEYFTGEHHVSVWEKFRNSDKIARLMEKIKLDSFWHSDTEEQTA